MDKEGYRVLRFCLLLGSLAMSILIACTCVPLAWGRSVLIVESNIWIAWFEVVAFSVLAGLSLFSLAKEWKTT